MACWYFPSNDYGENKGINDSGVATFRGTPLKSLAREICQNSLDAAIDKSVDVEFSNFQIKTTELPGVYELDDTFKKCLSFWKGQKAKSTKSFFENAIDKIEKDYINILRISDFKTKGLTGAESINDINTDWMRLTKSSGSSDKKGPAGGSFGIGKFAPFACSDFSTVFYSSYDVEGVCAYQGVSRLVTFEREDKQTTQGIGYYGNEKNTPVFDSLNLDSGFKRENGNYGTDIYIIGYKYADNDWKDDIIISILDSFLGAIWNEKLSVKVGDVILDKKSLPTIMEEYQDQLGNTYVKEYYQVLTSNKTIWKTEENHLGLGKIKLGYLLDSDNNDFHRKVAMIRQTGMKIKDGDHINGYIPFAGVLFIEGDKINEELRTLENPEHTEWQPDRAAYPFKAKNLIKSLNDFMKKTLEDIVKSNTDDEMDAVGVASFIPDSPDEEKEKNKEETISDNVIGFESRVIDRKFIPKVNLSKKGEDDSKEKVDLVDGNSDMDWSHGGEKPHHPPKPRDPNPVDYISGKEKTVNRPQEIKPSKFLYVCANPDKGEYMIDFVPTVSSDDGYMEFYLSGETESYKAKILKATQIGSSQIEIDDNILTNLAFKSGEHLRIKLQFDYQDYCSVEVKAYVNKK